jgi:hypothetical protein
MPTILNLGKEARDIIDELYFIDPIEEKVQFDLLQSVLNQKYKESEKKISYVLNLLIEAEAEAERVLSVEKQVIKKRKSAESVIKSLRNYLLFALEQEGLKKVKGDFSTVSLMEGREKAVVVDDSFLPESCVCTKIIRTPDTKALLQYIHENGPINGVMIVKNPFVVVR